VWDAVSGKELARLAGHEDSVTNAAFSPDGARIVTTSKDNTVRIWEATSGRELARLAGHENWVWSAAYSPDGTRIVSASLDNTARVWDAASGKELVRLVGHRDYVRSAAYSPDGTRIVTASDDGTARVWEAASGRVLVRLEAHGGKVWSAAFSPDGARIVTASNDTWAREWQAASGTAWVWDAASGRELARLRHGGRVLSAAFSPDGTRIVTASQDATARVWDAASGGELARLSGHERGVEGAAFSPDGSRVVTASEDGTARVWRAFPTRDDLVKAAQDRLRRCLSPAQRAAYFLSSAPPEWCVERALWPYHTDDWQAWLAALRAGRNVPLPNEPQTWAYVDLGSKLLEEGKVEEAKAQFEMALQRNPSAAKRINETWATTYINRGTELLSESKDEEAKAQFALPLQRDPGASKKIDETWASALVDRGTKLLLESKEEEAKAQFALALQRGGTAANEIVATLVRKGSDLISAADRNPAQAEAMRKAALALFEQAVNWAHHEGVENSARANAYFGRGRGHASIKEYLQALDDFREAEKLGHADASLQLWSTTMTMAQEKEAAQPIAGLLIAMDYALGLSEEAKAKIPVSQRKASTPRIYYPIGTLHGQINAASASPGTANECDRLASHPYDPLRVIADGVPIDKLDADAALAACPHAISNAPSEARSSFNRARAWTKIADTARKAKDEARTKTASDAMLADLKAAMERGYPMAFNNMANAYASGEGVEKDANRAADLYLEATNRVLHCCWVPVAHRILGDENKYDKASVQRVVGALTQWAAALDSQPARDLFVELSARGILPSATPLPPAKFTDPPPWW
jgi:tetratricopeptide (TPR) repeat protein